MTESKALARSRKTAPQTPPPIYANEEFDEAGTSGTASLESRLSLRQYTMGIQIFHTLLMDKFNDATLILSLENCHKMSLITYACGPLLVQQQIAPYIITLQT